MSKKVYACFWGDHGFIGNSPDVAYANFIESNVCLDRIPTVRELAWVEGEYIMAKIITEPIVCESTPKITYSSTGRCHPPAKRKGIA